MPQIPAREAIRARSWPERKRHQVLDRIEKFAAAYPVGTILPGGGEVISEPELLNTGRGSETVDLVVEYQLPSGKRGLFCEK